MMGGWRPGHGEDVGRHRAPEGRMPDVGKEASQPPGFPTVTPGLNDAAPTNQAARTRAFAQHVGPEIDMLLRVARTLTGSWADADDLVQDTLIRAYRGLESFDGAHPRAWLLTILRNTDINSHRRQRPDLLDADDSPERHKPAFGATSTPSPEQIVTERELGDDLQRALAALDPKFSTVLLLVLGIAVGTVTSRLSRACKRLRHDLNANANARRSS